MADKRDKTAAINCLINQDLKTRADVFAAINKKYLWQIVEEALKEYLDRREVNGVQ